MERLHVLVPFKLGYSLQTSVLRLGYLQIFGVLNVIETNLEAKSRRDPTSFPGSPFLS